RQGRSPRVAVLALLPRDRVGPATPRPQHRRARRRRRARPPAHLRLRSRRDVIDDALAAELHASHPRVAAVGTYIVDILGRPVDHLPRGLTSRLLEEIRMTPA